MMNKIINFIKNLFVEEQYIPMEYKLAKQQVLQNQYYNVYKY